MTMIETNIGSAAQPRVGPVVVRKDGWYGFNHLRVRISYKNSKIWLHGADLEFLALLVEYSYFGQQLPDAAVAKVYAQHKSAQVGVDALRRKLRLHLTPKYQASQPGPKSEPAFDPDRLFVRCRGSGYRLARKLRLQGSHLHAFHGFHDHCVNADTDESVAIDCVDKKTPAWLQLFHDPSVEAPNSSSPGDIREPL